MMENIGQEEMEPSCCLMASWRSLLTGLRNVKKRFVNRPTENFRLARVLNRLRRRLNERQPQATVECSASESQKATDTTEVTQAQVTGAKPLMSSKWVIIHRRKRLERQAEATERAASLSSLNETQTEEATETIETPNGVTKTIEVPEAIEDIKEMASDVPKMAEEAATQETMRCWGDIQSAPLEDADTIETVEGDQGLIPDDDLDSVSSFGSNCSELDRILNMEECNMDSLSSSLRDLVMERQYNMYEDPETVSIASSCSNLSGLDSRHNSEDHLDTLGNGTSISNLGQEDLFKIEEEEQDLNMMNQEEYS
ncbi:uncharacterized protein LOC134467896 [Engraulis encrasicolus]|uniref:uncharacterized protein LOC134467896 n=1 Tax=Engraulis encrasicolus TaxID=184585 RepID=UPI002FD00F46